jgi:peptidoglycan-associated lipoprotein
MLRLPVPPILLVAVLAAPLLVLGCAKRQATPVLPASTGSATTTPSASGARAGESSPSTAPVAGDATTTAPSSRGAGTAGAPPGGSPESRPNPRDFAAVRGLEDIYFGFDSYEIIPDAARILDTNARWMKANPGALVLIEGHTDERGTNEYNLALGERRAKAAMTYLVGQGVPAGRFTIISYGKEWPACREKTDACWARNRRAHFLTKRQ